ncbi:MAG: hypothetical protein K6A69_09610, partial [Lachnospiraceae bacterium]|nr:hypothetical protein [Lachnospiraceae bacterium]
MKKQIRKAIAFILSAIGTVAMIYVSGYLMLVQPIIQLYQAFRGDGITALLLFVSFIKIFLCTTMAGAIWCFFDIAAGF